MFIIRWIANIVAPVGFILAFLLAYFAIKPLTVPSQPELSLSSFLECEVSSIDQLSSFLSDEQIVEIKSQVGNGVPVELMNEFAFGKVTSSLINSMGSTTTLKTSYCELDKDSEEIIKSIQERLDTQNNYYTYSTLNEFIDKINTLPAARISAYDLKVPSTFVRTTYCNKPINQSNYYLFAIVPGKDEKNNVVMFQMNFIDNTNAAKQNVFARNIIQTGQYFKHKFNCNG